jgi:DNA modification methylase
VEKREMNRYYTIMFKDSAPTCWCCGKEIDEGTLIEWRKGFEKEILCDCCLGQLYRNDKEITILAVFHGWKSNIITGGKSE